MYSLVESKNNSVNGLGIEIKGASYYICDAEDASDPDIKNLPTNVGIGSKALCIYTGNIYMLGPSRKWVKYAGVSIMN